MAAEVHRRKKYQPRRMEYEPQFDGSAVRVPRRQPVEEPLRRPTVRPREKVRTRPKVQVREQGAVSLFAVAGFVAVAVCAVLVLYCNARLAVITDQTVQLRSQLAALQTEESSLLAQYELTYDLQEIENQLTADGSMVKAQPNQIVYLDMSEPDSMVYYQESQGGLAQVWESITGFFAGLF